MGKKHSLISNAIGKITSALTGVDKIQIEINGFEYWCYLSELWNYILSKINEIPVYTDKTWGFASSASASGSVYTGGYYEYSGTNNDFSPAINYGSVNGTKAAHIFIVTGAETVDEATITVTGTSITDEAVRTASDIDTIGFSLIVLKLNESGEIISQVSPSSVVR